MRYITSKSTFFHYCFFMASLFVVFNTHNMNNDQNLSKLEIEAYSNIIKNVTKNLPSYDEYDVYNISNTEIQQHIKQYRDFVYTSCRNNITLENSDNKIFMNMLEQQYINRKLDNNIQKLNPVHITYIYKYIIAMKKLFAKASNIDLANVKHKIGLPFFMTNYLGQKLEGWGNKEASNIVTCYKDKIYVSYSAAPNELNLLPLSPKLTPAQNYCGTTIDYEKNSVIKTININDAVTSIQTNNNGDNKLFLFNTSPLFNLRGGQTVGYRSFPAPVLHSICDTRDYIGAITDQNCLWMYNKKTNNSRTYSTNKPLHHLVSYDNYFIASDGEKLYRFEKNLQKGESYLRKNIRHMIISQNHLITVNKPNRIDIWSFSPLSVVKSLRCEYDITSLANCILDSDYEVIQISLKNNNYCFITPQDNDMPLENLPSRKKIHLTNNGMVYSNSQKLSAYSFPLLITEAWKKISLLELSLIGLYNRIEYYHSIQTV